jgi:hypothetical protein
MKNKSLDCKEFVNELLGEENILEVLRRVDHKNGRVFYDCFREEIEKPMFLGPEGLKESLQKAIEIYNKLQEARKLSDDEILELAKNALRFYLYLDKEKVEKIGENWNKVPSELKEKLMQIFLSNGWSSQILYFASQSPEHLKILEKYKPEVESMIIESINKEDYKSIGLSLPEWKGIYEKLNLNSQDIYEQVMKRIRRDIENYERWRLKEPEHPYGEIVKEVKRKSSSEFAEFIDRSERRNAKWYYIDSLVRNLFVARWSLLDDFPEDLKIKTVEEMVGNLAKFGDVFFLNILQKEIRLEEVNKYEPILQKYLPLAAENFAKLLEEGNYNILDEVPEVLSVIDRLPKNIVERTLRAYLKIEYSGWYLLKLVENLQVPIDIRIDATKKSVDYYIKKQDFEEVVDILLGKYEIPEEAKGYVEGKIRENSEVTLAYLAGLGRYKKIRTLIDNNVIRRDVVISRERLAEMSLDRLVRRYLDGEIFDSTFKENLEAIRSDEQVSYRIRERAEYLLKLYFSGK